MLRWLPNIDGLRPQITVISTSVLGVATIRFKILFKTVWLTRAAIIPDTASKYASWQLYREIPLSYHCSINKIGQKSVAKIVLIKMRGSL